MEWKQILMNIYDTIGTPILLSIFGVVSYLGAKFLKQIKGIMAAKVELVALTSENEIRKQVFDMLDSNVKAAVASNMQFASKMKSANDGKLTADNIKELQESTRRLVLNSLPNSLLKEDSSTLELIGGREKIDSVISTLIEKHVYEYHSAKCKV